jgi:hypothetical protein
MMRWHVARADTFERRAGVLLGFSGTVVAVVIGVGQGTFADRHPPGWAVGLLVASVVAFLVAGAWALMVLLVRTVRYPDLGQVEEEWREAKGEGEMGPLPAGEAIALVVNQLLDEGQTKDKSGKVTDSALQSFNQDAETRAARLKVSTAAFAAGVGLLAAVGIWVLSNRLG